MMWFAGVPSLPQLTVTATISYHTYPAYSRYQGDVIDNTKHLWHVGMVVIMADQLCIREFLLVDY